MDKTQAEIYSRQMLLPGLGQGGQEKLLSSSVLLCGVGGLGSPAALYLAAMGVGRLGLLDGDVVSLSNLNRQLLYTPADLEQPKALRAAERLQQQNPQLQLEAYPEYLSQENAGRILSGYDLILDCLDNFEARFILNDACIELGIPFIHGGVYRLNGQIMPIVPGKTPCLRCLFPKGYRSGAADKAILGATAGLIGSMQAMAAYKLLLSIEESPAMLVWDGEQGTCQRVELSPDPDCRCRQGSSTGKSLL